MQEVTYGILHFNPLRNDIASLNYLKAVESLFNNRNNYSNPIYLIDQGNPEEEFEKSIILSKKYDLNLIRLTDNVGIAAGVNIIADLAKTEFVSLVTSDVIFPVDCEKTLLDELRNNPKIGQICPLSNESMIPYQKTSVSDKDPTICIAQELTIQFWRREVFNKCRMHEPFKACYENLDFSLKLLKNGWYTAISNRVMCDHYHSGCVKSGARDLTYPEMNGQFDSLPIATKFRSLWPNINQADLYDLSKVKLCESLI